jgi:hypothetical protein
MIRVSRVLIAGLLVAGSACGHHNRDAAQSGAPQPTDRPVRVHVVNHYNEGMEIVASGVGITQRLGLVAAGLERDFVLPQSLVGNGSVEFRAQPSGFGQLVRSEPLVIRPGHIVDFEIATNLIGSRATLRP